MNLESGLASLEHGIELVTQGLYEKATMVLIQALPGLEGNDLAEANYLRALCFFHLSQTADSPELKAQYCGKAERLVGIVLTRQMQGEPEPLRTEAIELEQLIATATGRPTFRETSTEAKWIGKH